VEQARRLEPEELANLAAVQRWLKAHGRHWKVALGDDEVRQKLEVLALFSEFCDENLDALVDSLFRETPEGRRIRMKRRREVMALIEEFEASVAEVGTGAARSAGNVVRSLLIHNGVALGASPLR
jgi:hypothetical protein